MKNMKLVFWIISILALAIVLTGCQATGKAYYVASTEPMCKIWKEQCDAGKKDTCKLLMKCIDVYTKAEVDAMVSSLNAQRDNTVDGERVTVRHISIVDGPTAYRGLTCQQFCKTNVTNKGDLTGITNQNCMLGIAYDEDSGLVKSLDHGMCGQLIGTLLNMHGDKIACVCG